MSVKKGLTALTNSSPSFSNQALENSINELKIGWVIKSIELDTAIASNLVLTTSQKNDVKDTINNISYLNVGRYFGDIVRHTKTILDGTILGVTEGIEDFPQGSFIEIMQLVQALQTTIPDLYGMPASAKSRSVDDHLGILDIKFTRSDDSTQPVFTTMKESITTINRADLTQETALETAYNDLIVFLASVVADSTDFQQTLDTFATAVATAHTNLDTTLQSTQLSVRRTQMIADRDSIVTQLSLENANITSLRSYNESLADYKVYLSLADDTEIRGLMGRLSQNKNWHDYFETYAQNQSYVNPIYNNQKSDSSQEEIVNTVLRLRGLPDVTDYVDVESVALKALRDTRLNTKISDSKQTVNQIIDKACELLSIRVDNKDVYARSKALLDNMNTFDREIVKSELNLHNEMDTIS